MPMPDRTVSKYRALVQRAGPDAIHERVAIEATGLAEAKALLGQLYGAGKVSCAEGERESTLIR